MRKKDFPVSDVRKYLEPTPTVLVTAAYKDETNIMTMGWYTILEFTPSLIGCMITGSNHSFNLISRSGECVINLPTSALAKSVVAVGNTTGADTNKFETFGFTPVPATLVKAPLIKECFANFECKLYDRKLINTYNFFIFEIVKAHVATSPKWPETISYRGDSQFVLSGKNIRIHSDK